jgi:hypothetical protein
MVTMVTRGTGGVGRGGRVEGESGLHRRVQRLLPRNATKEWMVAGQSEQAGSMGLRVPQRGLHVYDATTVNPHRLYPITSWCLFRDRSSFCRQTAVFRSPDLVTPPCAKQLTSCIVLVNSYRCCVLLVLLILTCVGKNTTPRIPPNASATMGAQTG